MSKKCSICRREVSEENAAILAIGAAGTPRLLCEACERDFDELANGSDGALIRDAMDRIGKNMLESDADDKITLTTVSEMMNSARERVRLIESGEYVPEIKNEDGEGDELFGEEDEEIPEEYRETEEDRELDRREAEKNKKLDKITNWICIAAGAAAVVFMIIYAIKMFA